MNIFYFIKKFFSIPDNSDEIIDLSEAKDIGYLSTSKSINKLFTLSDNWYNYNAHLVPRIIFSQ